jgi:SAM-dependent methyltransferase
MLAPHAGPARSARTAPLTLPRDDMATRPVEGWRPPPLVPSATRGARLITVARRFFDLQAGSIWHDMAVLLPAVSGRVLDVGCGGQPYRSLFRAGVDYLGIDTTDARDRFGYDLPDTRLFDAGDNWPVGDDSVDTVLATETMEHVPDPAAFLREAARVLAPGGTLILTVPFAARWHFIPHDYWRYTPAALVLLLTGAGFREPRVYARGDAATVACYKLMTPMLSLLFAPRTGRGTVVRATVGLACAPLVLLLAIVANATLRRRGGDDTLGYTVIADLPGGS